MTLNHAYVLWVFGNCYDANMINTTQPIILLEPEASVLKKVEDHPLSNDQLVQAVLSAWMGLLNSKIGNRACVIGKDIFPKPQLIGSLLHELIPIEVVEMFPGEWRIDESRDDKDLECIGNKEFSIEIKTSSSEAGIYGNRSYTKTDGGGKSRGTYLLAVNFDKIEVGITPKIRRIRFGYVEADDWIAQATETGQQCRLSKESSKLKLVEIYNSKTKLI